MKFEEAIKVIKEDTTKGMYLKTWEPDTYVFIDTLTGRNGTSVKACIMHCKYGDVPWVPNTPNILYDDWCILDIR